MVEGSWGYAPIAQQQRLNIRCAEACGSLGTLGEMFSPAVSLSLFQLLGLGSKTQGSLKRRRHFHSLSQPRESTRRCQCMVLPVFWRENPVSTALSYRQYGAGLWHPREPGDTSKGQSAEWWMLPCTFFRVGDIWYHHLICFGGGIYFCKGKELFKS